MDKDKRKTFEKVYLEGRPVLVEMRIIQITLKDEEHNEIYFIETDKPSHIIIEQIERFKKHFSDANNEYPYNWECYNDDMQTKIGKLIDFEKIELDLY